MFNVSTLIKLNRLVGEQGGLLSMSNLQSTVASISYYSSYEEQVASISRSVMQNHPFIDGNKRTGVFFILSCFAAADIGLSKTDAEWEHFAVTSVQRRWSVAQIVEWLV